MPAGPKEAQSLKDAKSHVVNTHAALKKNDRAAAHKAWEMYNPVWNAMEVYVSFRSPENYNDIEMNWELKIDKAFETPTVTAAEILAMVEGQLATWEKAEKLAMTGPAISPLFDDVLEIRTQRQPLRKAMGLVNKGDIAGAKAAFGEFQKTWPTLATLLKTRSWAAESETDAAIKTAAAAFGKAGVTDAELKPLLAAILNRHTFGLNLFNAAARKADLSKKAASPEDIAAAGKLRGIQAHLKTNAAGSGIAPLFVAAEPALKAKALDAALKKSIDEAAATAGDASKAAASSKAAVEACEIAIEGLIGQFWSDPKLQTALQAATPK